MVVIRPKGLLKILMVIVAISCWALPLLAAETKPKKPSSPGESRVNLPQAVQIAIARNLRMADARLAVAEKEYQRREAFSDFFPTIDLSYTATGYRYKQLSNVQQLAAVTPARASAFIVGTTPDGPITTQYPYRIDPYKSFLMNATATQPLFTGGRLLNEYKYARLGVDYSEIQFELDRQNLILDVYEAYYQMMQGQQLLGVANSSIRALQALRNQTMEFYKAGVVPKVDVLSTEGQLAQAYIQQTQAQTEIERNRATLNLLLRNPQETNLQIIEDLTYRPSPYEIPEIYRTAAANRLEIRQSNISVEQAIALVKAAKADLLPNISVRGQGSRFNDDWNTFDPEANNDWRLQGILTWTFDMFRRRDTVQERRASQARTFVAREQLVENIMAEVKTTYLDMRRSESDIQNNRKAVEFRRENFRINQERYKEQVATYIEVLDAQRQLSSAEGDYIISLIGYMINRANLERRMGILRQ